MLKAKNQAENKKIAKFSAATQNYRTIDKVKVADTNLNMSLVYLVTALHSFTERFSVAKERSRMILSVNCR